MAWPFDTIYNALPSLPFQWFSLAETETETEAEHVDLEPMVDMRIYQAVKSFYDDVAYDRTDPENPQRMSQPMITPDGHCYENERLIPYLNAHDLTTPKNFKLPANYSNDPRQLVRLNRKLKTAIEKVGDADLSPPTAANLKKLADFFIELTKDTLTLGPAPDPVVDAANVSSLESVNLALRNGFSDPNSLRPNTTSGQEASAIVLIRYVQLQQAMIALKTELSSIEGIDLSDDAYQDLAAIKDDLDSLEIEAFDLDQSNMIGRPRVRQNESDRRFAARRAIASSQPSSLSIIELGSVLAALLVAVLYTLVNALLWRNELDVSPNARLRSRIESAASHVMSLLLSFASVIALMGLVLHAGVVLFGATLFIDFKLDQKKRRELGETDAGYFRWEYLLPLFVFAGIMYAGIATGFANMLLMPVFETIFPFLVGGNAPALYTTLNLSAACATVGSTLTMAYCSTRTFPGLPTANEGEAEQRPDPSLDDNRLETPALTPAPSGITPQT